MMASCLAASMSGMTGGRGRTHTRARLHETGASIVISFEQKFAGVSFMTSLLCSLLALVWNHPYFSSLSSDLPVLSVLFQGRWSA